MPSFTPKQRMLNAYRGEWSDRAPVAPEFWYYYPATLLGVDMIEFEREVPFHLALKQTFETFKCEGWGAAFGAIPNPQVTRRSEERWNDEGRLEVRSTTVTPAGSLTSATVYDRQEPSWTLERPIKDLGRDLPAYEMATLADPEGLDPAPLIRAWEEVGESYLLEAWLGVPFFDYFAEGREGGFAVAIYDLMEQEDLLLRLRERYQEHVIRLARVICERTPLESLVLGCSWSNNSLLGPQLWRRWDKPVIAAVAEEIHRHKRLLHLHFHGKCRETVGDFAELGLDCVCPFERPPGGDIVGLEGLREAARLLHGKTTMNGNVHTVETLIRGTEAEVRREVQEVWEAFQETPRVIIGTGDQVGRETPEENLWAMIDEAKRISAR
ncbi:MAG: hypothetical protein GX100_05005 [candidate division WS1 bacterium]|nr:hypothetical protein [candidate division WS1 bacterium]